MDSSEGSWWAIATWAVLLYTAVVVPWMPAVTTRLRMAAFPLVLVAAIPYPQWRGVSVPEALGAATGLVPGVPLGVVGRYRQWARYLRDRQTDPRNETDRPSQGSLRGWHSPSRP